MVRVSDVDEEAVLDELIRRRREAGLAAPTAAEQVQALARAKALDVMASTDPQEAEVVVGCDSMLEISGQVVGKPIDAADAHERWRMMSGSSGTLHTGHFLVRTTDGAIAEGVSSATIRFGSPSQTEIEAYIATGEPLWCAGAFTIDGLGGAFIEGIDAVEMYRSRLSQEAEALRRQRAVDAATVGVTGAALDVPHVLQASDRVGQP